MKKVVRLTESDLTRLVRRIISEAPFDDSRGFEKFNFDLNPDPSYEDMEPVINANKDRLKTYDEFKQNGIPMEENDIEILMMIAYEYCKDSRNSWICPQIKKIEKKLDDVHHINFSKRPKRY
jgi:hypothetical protein